GALAAAGGGPGLYGAATQMVTVPEPAHTGPQKRSIGERGPRTSAAVIASAARASTAAAIWKYGRLHTAAAGATTVASTGAASAAACGKRNSGAYEPDGRSMRTSDSCAGSPEY